MESSVQLGPRHDRTKHRRRRYAKRWLAVAAALSMCGVGAVIYEVFFHVYDVGPKSVVVNGEPVEQIDGLAVHAKTWLSKADVETLLSRIQVNPLPFPRTKTYHGAEYVEANALVSALTQDGDVSQNDHDRISIALKSNHHYTYQGQSGDIIRQQAIDVDGRAVGNVLTVSHDEATYVPAKAMATVLSSEGLPSTWTDNGLHLGLTSPASPGSIEEPKTSTVIAFGSGQALYAPIYSWHGDAYVPVNSLNAALSQLGWTSSSSTFTMSLNSSGRAVQPASAPASTSSHKAGSQTGSSAKGLTHKEPLVMAFVPFYSGYMGAFHDVTNHGKVFDGITLDTWTVGPSGNLLGSAPAGTATESSKDGDFVTAMVTNLTTNGFDAKEMTSILSNQTSSSRLKKNLVGAVLSDGYDGVTLDFEAIPASDRAGYSSFVARLATALHDHGKSLDVVVPADTRSSGEPWNQAYDLAKIGQSADAVIVMAYDYSYPGGPSGPIAPLPWVQQTLSYTVSRVPAQKVILGLDAYGYDWAGKHTTAVGLPTIDSFVSAHHIHVNWDETAEAPWYTWTDSKGVGHTVYYENGQSTAAKLQLAQAYGIKGVALWRAGLEDSAILNALGSYAKGN